MDTLKEIGIQRWKLRAQPHEISSGQAAATGSPEPQIIPTQATGNPAESVDKGARSNQDNVSREMSKPPIMAEQEAAESPATEPHEKHSWQSLSDLLTSGSNCPSCATTNPVLGAGNINAQWMFVVDGPSARDMQGGSLLSGRQGQLFDSILQAVGLTAEDIYLTSIFKCPPSPDTSLLAQCGELVHHQIKLIQPKLVLTMGEFAAQSLLRANEELDQLRSADNAYPGGTSGVICTYSLVEMLHDPGLKARVWQDIKRCMAALQQA